MSFRANSPDAHSNALDRGASVRGESACNRFFVVPFLSVTSWVSVLLLKPDCENSLGAGRSDIAGVIDHRRRHRTRSIKTSYGSCPCKQCWCDWLQPYAAPGERIVACIEKSVSAWYCMEAEMLANPYCTTNDGP